MALQVGETLGRYQLEALVGQGGMAVVYRAVDSVLGRTVAVKVIRPAYTEDPQFLDRFLQEARLVASLDHPNVLPLYDFGEEKGRPYLVLPYLPGGSLADRLAAMPQPLALVAAWTIQLAGALDAAHARGVLHRDVKPGNVLVTNDGRLVLGDFGIARLAEATTRLTATGMVVGTPIYMAPELARGREASPASDRYALAVMLYEMLAGLPPFLGSNPLSVLHQQVHEPVPALAGRLDEVPAGLDAFFERALAKEPERRHRTCRAMAEELVALLSPEQRAELSTLVWTGAPDSTSGSSPEALTVVHSGRTMRMPGSAGGSAVRRPYGGAGVAGSVHTSAVTAETPRPRRGSPLLWGLIAAAGIAAAVLLVPRDRLIGGGSATAASESPAAAGAGAPAAASGNDGLSGGSLPAPPAASPAVPAAQRPSAPPGEDGAAAAPAEREVTPLDPPALGLPAAAANARDLLALSRRPSHRMSAAELERVIAATGGQAATMLPPVQALRTWAQGGLAYAQGRTTEASELRRELVPATAPWGIAWAVSVFTSGSAWELPAIYADPRNDLDSLLQPALPGLGGNGRAALAAAYSAHLDGNHAGALRLLADVGFDPSSAVAAQFLAAEAIEARDEAAMRRWFPAALDGGRAPLLRAFLNEVKLLAAENLDATQQSALQQEVCRAVPGWCGAQRPVFQKPVERPLRNDRFGRRRTGPRGSGGGGGPGRGLR